MAKKRPVYRPKPASGMIAALQDAKVANRETDRELQVRGVAATIPETHCCALSMPPLRLIFLSPLLLREILTQAMAARIAALQDAESKADSLIQQARLKAEKVGRPARASMRTPHVYSSQQHACCTLNPDCTTPQWWTACASEGWVHTCTACSYSMSVQQRIKWSIFMQTELARKR